MGNERSMENDFSQLARLALSGSQSDVLMFVRRVARRSERLHPELAKELEKLVAKMPTRSSIVREALAHPPVDADSRLQLLRTDQPIGMDEPIWTENVRTRLMQIVSERKRVDDLLDAGLVPTRSALFVGPPGVGKTMSARWLASALGLPLLTLDLSAVMSSFLGRTGGNLRNVTDYARGTPSVLLLDEFDAIAKRRDDVTEIGELKRLVTVLLQEIESWPAEGFLIAASNHAELLDPAVWRRFDLVVEFELPGEQEVQAALRQLLPEQEISEALFDVLCCAMQGLSHSDIKRSINQAKRASLLKCEPLAKCLEADIRQRVAELPKKQQIQMAVRLGEAGASQYDVEKLTGVSRPTQRKYRAEGEVA